MCVFLGLSYLEMGWPYGENFWALGQLGPPKNGGSIFSPIILNIKFRTELLIVDWFSWNFVCICRSKK